MYYNVKVKVMLVKKIEVKLNETQQNQFLVDQNNLRFIHNFYLSYQDLNNVKSVVKRLIEI